MDVRHHIYALSSNEAKRLAKAKSAHNVEHKVVDLVSHVE